MLSVSVASRGPPPVITKIGSKVRIASMKRRSTATPITGRSIGSVTNQKRCHGVAPST